MHDQQAEFCRGGTLQERLQVLIAEECWGQRVQSKNCRGLIKKLEDGSRRFRPAGGDQAAFPGNHQPGLVTAGTGAWAAGAASAGWACQQQPVEGKRPALSEQTSMKGAQRVQPRMLWLSLSTPPAARALTRSWAGFASAASFTTADGLLFPLWLAAESIDPVAASVERILTQRPAIASKVLLLEPEAQGGQQISLANGAGARPRACCQLRVFLIDICPQIMHGEPILPQATADK
jgi:hypothetical protein